MKIHQIKFGFILLVTSIITILGLSNCGQQTSTEKTSTKSETAKQETAIPSNSADSQASIPANEVKIEKADHTQEEKNTVVKKETEPVKKLPAEQNVNVVNDNKTGAKTQAAPSVNQPVIETKPAPDVVKVTEPIKPTAQPQPKAAEVPKPVVVAKPSPEQDGWIVPAKYKTMINAYPATKESIALGKSLYSTNCKSCHGNKGDGDGTKAATIDTKMRSFRSAGFLAQEPGEIFYKVSTGRKDMPKFEKKIPDDEDRWALVHYIMNL
ncbi:MAG TPA: c-type cytochrome [Hanamia sp.]